MKARSALLAALLAFTSAACPGRKPSPAPSPSPALKTGNGLNVLLITIDTLRADHLGAYGYARKTSPNLDAFAAQGTLFERAYTYWPKTRGSFVMIHTGRLPSENGYGKTHPILVGFNPTLASVLREAGYAPAAVVDNPNVATEYGYDKGFASYRETWEEKDLATEMDRTRAITKSAISYLEKPPLAHIGAPFFLWLHYVNPHAPYTPPAPYDTAFLDDDAKKGPKLPVVTGFHGGIHKDWAVAGQDRLGWYVAQYDGEIAAVDAEVGQVLEALDRSPWRERTVVAITSDHGESLGEHGYYFDHGEDVFDPTLEIPLMLRVPGAPAGQRSQVLASTLDLVPTLLDAVKVSYPPGLAGASLLGVVKGGAGPARDRLFSQNDRNLTATYDARHKLVAVPKDDGGAVLSLYDREKDPGEESDLSKSEADLFRVHRRELELFQERFDKQWVKTRALLQDQKAGEKPTPEACERLKAMGYVVAGC